MERPYENTPAALLIGEGIRASARNGRMVAEEIGIKRNILSMYARGDAAFPVRYVRPLALALGIAPETLFETCKESYAASLSWQGASLDAEPVPTPAELELLSVRVGAARHLAGPMRGVDVATDAGWKAVVEAALGAVASEGRLVRALGCSRDDIQAWLAGHRAPAAASRDRMRESLVKMVDAWVAENEARPA